MKEGSKFVVIEDRRSTYELIGGKDACTGDSVRLNTNPRQYANQASPFFQGAPLWIEMGLRKRRAFVVGVVSRGFNCATHNLPGIYVRVKKFLGWIQDNIVSGRCSKSDREED